MSKVVMIRWHEANHRVAMPIESDIVRPISPLARMHERSANDSHTQRPRFLFDSDSQVAATHAVNDITPIKHTMKLRSQCQDVKRTRHPIHFVIAPALQSRRGAEGEGQHDRAAEEAWCKRFNRYSPVSAVSRRWSEEVVVECCES